MEQKHRPYCPQILFEYHPTVWWLASSSAEFLPVVFYPLMAWGPVKDAGRQHPPCDFFSDQNAAGQNEIAYSTRALIRFTIFSTVELNCWKNKLKQML